MRKRPNHLLVALLSLTLFTSVFVSGCGTTSTIMVPPGMPIQLAEDVKAYVYVKVDGKWIRSEHRVVIPAGWWCLPDDEN